MRTFVVNLKRREDRKEQICSRLPDYFETTFTSEWEGPMDGKKIDSDTLRAHGYSLFPWEMAGDNQWWNRPMKKGEVGCAISHWLCWKYAASLDLSHYLFLEDDVYFSNDFAEALPEKIAQLEGLDPTWDLLFLGCSPQEEAQGKLGDFILPGFTYGAYGYMLSRSALQKIMATHFYKDLIPTDEFLPAMYMTHPRQDVFERYPPCMKAYSLDPLVCFPFSFIGERFGSDIASSEIMLGT